MVEGTGLENRHTVYAVSRVRISPCPSQNRAPQVFAEPVVARCSGVALHPDGWPSGLRRTPGKRSAIRSDFAELAQSLGNRRKGCERFIHRFAPFLHSNMGSRIHARSDADTYEASRKRGGRWNAPHSRLARTRHLRRFFFTARTKCRSGISTMPSWHDAHRATGTATNTSE